VEQAGLETQSNPRVLHVGVLGLASHCSPELLALCFFLNGLAASEHALQNLLGKLLFFFVGAQTAPEPVSLAACDNEGIATVQILTLNRFLFNCLRTRSEWGVDSEQGSVLLHFFDLFSNVAVVTEVSDETVWE